MKESKYYLMDGRALFDIDKAAVLETCDTLEEAKKNIDLYGSDTCIVEIKTRKVVYSLSWENLSES